MCEYQGQCWNKFDNVPINVLDCLACIYNREKSKNEKSGIEKLTKLEIK